MFVKMLTAQLLREVRGGGFDEFHVKAVWTIFEEHCVHFEAFMDIGFINYSYHVLSLIVKVVCGLCHQD